MKIIAERIQNRMYRELHWDFIRETALSFNATLFESNNGGLMSPQKGVVALRHDKGVSIESFDLSQVHTLLVGSDDSGEDEWMEGYKSIRIPTPNNHFLWSGVALGIFLYEHSKLNSTASCSLPLTYQDGC